jgi:hypothetical protein
MRDGLKEKRSVAVAPLRAAALSTLLLSCAYQRPYDVIPPRQPPPLSAQWSRGTCSFSANSLTYSDSAGNRQGLTLDVKVRAPSRILCTDDYTIIMTPGSAVLSLGADAVLEGRESLGCLGSVLSRCEGGRSLLVNSVEINLAPLSREDGGFSGERISGDQLSIRTARGRTWTLALSDPFGGWNVY